MTVLGLETVMPVGVYLPGGPTSPGMVVDGLMQLQDKIKDQRTTGRRPASEARPEIFEV